MSLHFTFQLVMLEKGRSTEQTPLHPPRNTLKETPQPTPDKWKATDYAVTILTIFIKFGDSVELFTPGWY